MIGPAIGADDSFTTCYGDCDAICADLGCDTIFGRGELCQGLDYDAGEREHGYERRNTDKFRRDFHVGKLALSTLRGG